MTFRYDFQMNTGCTQITIVCLVSLFSIGLQAAPAAPGPQVCSGASSVPASAPTKNEAESKITAFASKKVIAEKADALLSKLITAKSPVLMSWIKNRDLGEKSETEIALEWRQYFARNFILSKYPHGDAAVDKEIETLGNSILALYKTKAFVEKMERLFARSKATALDTIQKFALSDAQKKSINSRITPIELYWPKDFKSARNNSIPLDIIDWGIAYDPMPNQINIGLNATTYPNDETVLAVFAHEIGHAIDSCRWGAFLTGPWPFEAVGNCLRGEKSAGAKKRDDTLLEKLVKEGAIKADLAESLRQNPTCNKLIYPPPTVQADQLPESFADWFSAEVISNMNLDSLTNLRSDLCSEGTLNPGTSYPENSTRLIRIYFSHPKLREKQKLPASSDFVYCQLK